jgi:hypothetical protein
MESEACELTNREGWMVAMSNNYWDEEDDEDTTIDTATDGTDLLKKLRKAKRGDEKRIKDLEEKLEGYLKKDRESSVAKVLEQKGVNPKAARLILKDLDEVNEESINGWLEDNGDLFGITPSQDAPKANETDLAALRQQDVLTQGAITPDRAEDIEMRLDQAQSAEDIYRILGR